MKKKLVVALLVASMALSMTACGGKKDVSNDTQAPVAQAVSGDESYGEVELGEYKGLSVEKQIVAVDDSAIDEAIEDLIEENVQYNPVDRGIETDDYVEIYYTASVDGTVVADETEELSYLYAGEEDFGEEFDASIMGHKAGEEVKFSVSYDSEYYDENFAGKTVDYVVKIDSVNEVVAPELTDDFIINTLGYESEDDMRAKIKEELVEQNSDEATSEMYQTLMQQVIDNSTIKTYSQELYDSFKEEVSTQYQQTAEMFGLESADELYEMYGMTEADIEEEILYYVYEVIVTNAIAEKENIELTDDEFKAGAQAYADAEEYDNVDDYLADYGEDSVRFWLLEEKVYKFLADNATITEVEATEDELMDLDDTEYEIDTEE